MNLCVSQMLSQHIDPAKFDGISRFEAECQLAKALGCKMIRSAINVHGILPDPALPPDARWVTAGAQIAAKYGLGIVLVLDPRVNQASAAWLLKYPANALDYFNPPNRMFPDVFKALAAGIRACLAAQPNTTIQLLNEPCMGGNQAKTAVYPWGVPSGYCFSQVHSWLNYFLSNFTDAASFIGPSTENEGTTSPAIEFMTMYQMKADWQFDPRIVGKSFNCHPKNAADFQTKYTGLKATHNSPWMTESGLALSSLGLTAVSDANLALLGQAQLDLWKKHEELEASTGAKMFFFSASNHEDTTSVTTRGLMDRQGNILPGGKLIYEYKYPPSPPTPTRFYTPKP